MTRWRPIVIGLTLCVLLGGGAVGVARFRLADRAAAQAAPATGVPTPSPVADRPVADPPVDDRVEQRQAARERTLEQIQRRHGETALTAALQRYDDDLVDLAVSVLDRNTGRGYSYDRGRVFETGSVIKVDILGALLLQAQRGGRALSAQEKNLAENMIEDSDNDAATQLWQSTGGMSGCAQAFGLTATTPDTGGYWGLTTTTADDQARLVAALADPNGPVRNGGYVLDLMGRVDSQQAWGISAAARPGESVALKNGWLSRDNEQGRWIVNSIGRITGAGTDVVVVVLSRGHATMGSGIAMVESVTKEARADLGW